MEQINSYQDLTVWQKGMDLAVAAYHLTKSFPKEELFGMTSQIRRSASSIPANIAEGWGRGGTKEYIHFLKIAQGSLKELETHLILCQRVELCPPLATTPLLSQTQEIGKMIRALIGSLQQRIG
jgi:four helix bundle protein